MSEETVMQRVFKCDVCGETRAADCNPDGFLVHPIIKTLRDLVEVKVEVRELGGEDSGASTGVTRYTRTTHVCMRAGCLAALLGQATAIEVRETVMGKRSHVARKVHRKPGHIERADDVMERPPIDSDD